MDYVLPAVHARYLRLASAPRTSDWGVSVFEFEPLAVSESPRSGLEKGRDPAALWSAQVTGTIIGTDPASGARELRVTLPRALPVSGLEVFWASARRGARLEGRGASGKWLLLADDPVPLGDSSYLAAHEARSVTSCACKCARRQGACPRLDGCGS